MHSFANLFKYLGDKISAISKYLFKCFDYYAMKAI